MQGLSLSEAAARLKAAGFNELPRAVAIRSRVLERMGRLTIRTSITRCRPRYLSELGTIRLGNVLARLWTYIFK
jgi:hypothetical protein